MTRCTSTLRERIAERLAAKSSRDSLRVEGTPPRYDDTYFAFLEHFDMCCNEDDGEHEDG